MTSFHSYFACSLALELHIGLGSGYVKYIFKNLKKWQHLSLIYTLYVPCGAKTSIGISFSFATDLWHVFTLTSHALLQKNFKLVLAWTRIIIQKSQKVATLHTHYCIYWWYHIFDSLKF